MRELTYQDALKEALREEMHRDSDVFIAGEDVGIWGGVYQVTAGLLDEFGEKRVKDTPLSEIAIIGTAIGSAATGLRPVVELMLTDFALVCFDQITNQAAKMHYMFGGQSELPLVIRTVNGGGSSAAAQHSQSLEALFTHFPGLKVVMPSTAYDAKGLLLTSIRDNNPVIFIEHGMLYGTPDEVPEEEYEIPFGQADIKREGQDITIVAYSYMLQEALAAAEELSKEGIEAEVVDPRTLTPLDTKTIIESVSKTNRLVIVHEA
ncbi:MAG: alpha-ketoacid dehydrogenase subunit beta, partial [bacterium]